MHDEGTLFPLQSNELWKDVLTDKEVYGQLHQLCNHLSTLHSCLFHHLQSRGQDGCKVFIKSDF